MNSQDQTYISFPPHVIHRMIVESAPEYGREKARQDALSKTYKVDQELFDRLQMCKRTIRQAIRDGRLRATPTTDKKGYRVSELACREFLGDVVANTTNA